MSLNRSTECDYTIYLLSGYKTGYVYKTIA